MQVSEGNVLIRNTSHLLYSESGGGGGGGESERG